MVTENFLFSLIAQSGISSSVYTLFVLYSPCGREVLNHFVESPVRSKESDDSVVSFSAKTTVGIRNAVT
jgi:hypothetical protein